MSDLTPFPLTPALVSLSRIPQEFRDNAEHVRYLSGSKKVARVWKAAAERVEEWIAESLLEPLTLEAAVSESGYTRNHLGRMIRNRTLPNAGTDTEPLILRMHLPRKPGHGFDAGTIRPASSRVQAARAVIEGEE